MSGKNTLRAVGQRRPRHTTASIVFTLCDGQHAGNEIADLVATAFQLDAPPVTEVDTCLETFAREGLLR